MQDDSEHIMLEASSVSETFFNEVIEKYGIKYKRGTGWQSPKWYYVAIKKEDWNYLLLVKKHIYFVKQKDDVCWVVIVTAYNEYPTDLARQWHTLV